MVLSRDESSLEIFGSNIYHVYKGGQERGTAVSVYNHL